ncbi:MAG: ABC-2 type transport system permease protein [Anaerolineaceae bacterium]|nr:MAG: ABC-2 type transport system permease protein [Anaerolineaceae bacterium]
MRNIWTIARREYRQYFISPIAYIIALATLLWVGIYFVVVINYVAAQAYYYAPPAPGVSIVIGQMATIFLLASPALTMRLLADEQRMGTMELLLTTPMHDWELVVGKWLGSFLFALTLIGVSLIYPLVLHTMTTGGIDQGLLLSGYVAIILLSAVFLAIGTAISALFSNQFAAFFATLAILLALWWLISLPTYVLPPGTISDIFNYLTLNGRFNAMLDGVITNADIVYHLSLTALGLFLGTVAVEMRRWR